MSRPGNHDAARRTRRSVVIVIAGVAGFALAAIAGVASATSFTLKVSKNVHVTNAMFKSFAVKAVNINEAVAVGPAGYAVYTFQGETTHHIICKKTTSTATNCWGFWPPVSVSSAKGIGKESGISGKLGSFRNHGLTQLTLNGQPLYYFTPDLMAKNKRQANGDQLKTFGSIWHVVTAKGGAAAGTRSTGTTMTSSTPAYTYPPGY